MMFGRTIGLSIVLALSTLLLAHASQTETVPIREPLASFPDRVGAWVGTAAPPLTPDILEKLGADDYVERLYRSQERVPLDLYIGYYGSQRLGDTIHSPMNCLPGNGWEPVTRGRLTIDLTPADRAAVAAAPRATPVIEVNRVVIEKGVEKQLVLYWYQSRDRVIASDYWGKIYKFVDAVRLNRTDSALVRVITPIGDSEMVSEARAEQRAMSFVQIAFPFLGRYLPP